VEQTSSELITRVGPGTPMGELMREYWVPAMLGSELPVPDGDPVRVKLLGEELIAFRDTTGSVGLVANGCPHRGASLFFGRNEQGGLRCVYHGWKFDTSGACLDMPNEPPFSKFKNTVRAVAYPCIERAGIVWAYLGPRTIPPPFPEIEATTLAEGAYKTDAIFRECNWLQALEGDMDTAHFVFLHYGGSDPAEARPGSFMQYQLQTRAASYEVVETESGALYGACRPAKPGQNYWRIGQFHFPFYTMIPTGVLGYKVGIRAWVPMDDTHTMSFGVVPIVEASARARGYLKAPEVREAVARSPLLPNTTDWFGRFRTAPNAANDYEIDRDWQRQGNYTGIDGIFTQDAAVTESMGAVADRSLEHLGTSDVMVRQIRRRLTEAALALAEKGTPPPAVDSPAAYATRTGGIVLPEGEDWFAATEALRRAFVDHPELDTTADV